MPEAGLGMGENFSTAYCIVCLSSGNIFFKNKNVIIMIMIKADKGFQVVGSEIVCSRVLLVTSVIQVCTHYVSIGLGD